MGGVGMSRKYDRLAEGLAERLAASPVRGRAFVNDMRPDDAPTRSAAQPSGPRHLVAAPVRHDDERLEGHEPAASPLVDGSTTSGDEPTTGSIRRGHLVPAHLHGRALRCKVECATRTRITWNDVLLDGVGQLVRCDDVVQILDAVTVDGPPSRLVQATLPIDLDRRLAALHIDLNEALDRRVTFEQLWAGAIALWMIGSDRSPV
jgi:hypothetical protein